MTRNEVEIGERDEDNTKDSNSEAKAEKKSDTREGLSSRGEQTSGHYAEHRANEALSDTVDSSCLDNGRGACKYC